MYLFFFRNLFFDDLSFSVKCTAVVSVVCRVQPQFCRQRQQTTRRVDPTSWSAWRQSSWSCRWGRRGRCWAETRRSPAPGTAPTCLQQRRDQHGVYSRYSLLGAQKQLLWVLNWQNIVHQTRNRTTKKKKRQQLLTVIKYMFCCFGLRAYLNKAKAILTTDWCLICNYSLWTNSEWHISESYRVFTTVTANKIQGEVTTPQRQTHCTDFQFDWLSSSDCLCTVQRQAHVQTLRWRQSSTDHFLADNRRLRDPVTISRSS